MYMICPYCLKLPLYFPTLNSHTQNSKLNLLLAVLNKSNKQKLLVEH